MSATDDRSAPLVFTTFPIFTTIWPQFSYSNDIPMFSLQIWVEWMSESIFCSLFAFNLNLIYVEKLVNVNYCFWTYPFPPLVIVWVRGFEYAKQWELQNMPHAPLDSYLCKLFQVDFNVSTIPLNSHVICI